ncbi:MAG: hypothetical protein KBH29_01255 [Lutibacter sp.]|nr:hypothetical protein [Lutibacter sp.]
MRKIILTFLILVGYQSFSQEILPEIMNPFFELNKKVNFERIINESELGIKIDLLSEQLNTENGTTIRIASCFRVDENNIITIGNIRTSPKGYERIASEIIMGFTENELKLMSKKAPINILTKVELGNYKKRIKKNLKKY